MFINLKRERVGKHSQLCSILRCQTYLIIESIIEMCVLNLNVIMSLHTKTIQSKDSLFIKLY